MYPFHFPGVSKAMLLLQITNLLVPGKVRFRFQGHLGSEGTVLKFKHVCGLFGVVVLRCGRQFYPLRGYLKKNGGKAFLVHIPGHSIVL